MRASHKTYNMVRALILDCHTGEDHTKHPTRKILGDKVVKHLIARGMNLERCIPHWIQIRHGFKVSGLLTSGKRIAPRSIERQYGLWDASTARHSDTWGPFVIGSLSSLLADGQSASYPGRTTRTVRVWDGLDRRGAADAWELFRSRSGSVTFPRRQSSTNSISAKWLGGRREDLYSLTSPWLSSDLYVVLEQACCIRTLIRENFVSEI